MLCANFMIVIMLCANCTSHDAVVRLNHEFFIINNIKRSCEAILMKLLLC